MVTLLKEQNGYNTISFLYYIDKNEDDIIIKNKYFTEGYQVFINGINISLDDDIVMEEGKLNIKDKELKEARVLIQGQK